MTTFHITRHPGTPADEATFDATAIVMDEDGVVSSRIAINGAADVAITEVFNGISLLTDDLETVGICMRDSGFEIIYRAGEEERFIELKNGVVTQHQDSGPFASIHNDTIALVAIDITDDEATALLIESGRNGKSVLLATGMGGLLPVEENRWAYAEVAKMRRA